MMKQVKITVLKTTLDKELAEETGCALSSSNWRPRKKNQRSATRRSDKQQENRYGHLRRIVIHCSTERAKKTAYIRRRI